MGQLHLDSSISELRYLAIRTIFSDCPLAKMITGLIKLLPFRCTSLFTGDIISYCSKISSSLFTLSCNFFYLVSVYSLGLIGNWIQKQIVLHWNLILNSYFGYFDYSIGYNYFMW